MSTRSILSFRVALAVMAVSHHAYAVEWVRGGPDGKQPLWGINRSLQFAIPPAARGPRGLIRILYPTLPDGKYDLINFIAIEPVVKGQRGLSELEPSRMDSVPGKRLWVESDGVQGRLSKGKDSVEMLQVVIHVEKFDNGAHVRLLIEQRSDRPDEIAITVQAEPDSEPMEYCILTATMGNKARARLLWLKDETVSSLKLYPDYQGPDFTEPTVFPLKALTVTSDGELLVAITTDEQRPADTRPFTGTGGWYYGGFKVTQYWKKLKGTWRDDVHAVVNGRFRYWRSTRAIPGGIAFENFELRERYYPKQQFIFGITSKSPTEIGIRR